MDTAKIISLFNSAQAHKDREEYSDSAKIYEEILSITTQLPEVYFNLSIVYSKLDKYKESIKCLEEFLKAEPNDIEAKYFLATHHFMLKDYVGGYELFESRISKFRVGYVPGSFLIDYNNDELLKFLSQKNIKIAVATASPVERAKRYLEKVNLLSYFNKIISARNMNEGKPSPDVYLFACNELELPPEECLAIEDSPNGVLSAARAGCKVVMVPEFIQPDYEISKLLFAKKENLSEIIELF